MKKKARVLSSFFPMRRSCLSVGVALPVSKASIRASEVPTARASSPLAMNMLSRAHRRVGPLIGISVMVFLPNCRGHCCGPLFGPGKEHRALSF